MRIARTEERQRDGVRHFFKTATTAVAGHANVQVMPSGAKSLAGSTGVARGNLRTISDLRRCQSERAVESEHFRRVLGYAVPPACCVSGLAVFASPLVVRPVQTNWQCRAPRLIQGGEPSEGEEPESNILRFVENQRPVRHPLAASKPKAGAQLATTLPRQSVNAGVR